MHRLTLFNFRSHQHTCISFSKNTVCLVGNNGAGKTNILEALSLFSPGKGLRSQNTHWMLQGASHVWHLRLELESPTGPLHLETLERHNKRIFIVNDVRLKHQLDISQWICMNWVTPATDRMWSQGWSCRRKYFDRMMFTVYPHYGAYLQRYQKAVQERNYGLKHMASSYAFDVLEDNMARMALEIFSLRQRALQQLNEALSHVSQDFIVPTLHTEGAFESYMHNADRTCEDLRAMWHTLRGPDQHRGVTSFGPHHTNWTVIHPKNQEIAICSTGEQKIMLLSLILAWCRVVQTLHPKEFHFLLLDEVGAHLDAEHRKKFWKELQTFSMMTWMTGVERTIFEDISECHCVEVKMDEGFSKITLRNEVGGMGTGVESLDSMSVFDSVFSR